LLDIFANNNKKLYLKATITFVRKVFSRPLLGTRLVGTSLEGVFESQVSCQVVVVVGVFVGYPDGLLRFSYKYRQVYSGWEDVGEFLTIFSCLALSVLWSCQNVQVEIMVSFFPTKGSFSGTGCIASCSLTCHCPLGSGS